MMENINPLSDWRADFFVCTFKVELGEVNFRKKAVFSAKKQNSLKEQIKISLENYLWLENMLEIDYTFSNPVKNIKVQAISDIENAISVLKNAWNIGNDPVHNIIELCEDNEIKVIEIFDVDDKFDGLATYVNDKFPVIVLNGNFLVERKRFTLLHELGHLLLNLPDCEVKEEENFCNKFASEFLLPKKTTVDEFGKKRTSITLPEFISIQKKYGISIPAIMYRLVDADIISAEKQRQFYIQLNSNPELKIKVNESRFETPERSSRFERLVYRALSQEAISFSKASALINKDLTFLKENHALI